MRVVIDRSRSRINADPDDAAKENVPNRPTFKIGRNCRRGVLPPRLGAPSLNVLFALVDRGDAG
jgi:hypothetical protein